jgi:hypothetical protein
MTLSLPWASCSLTPTHERISSSSAVALIAIGAVSRVTRDAGPTSLLDHGLPAGFVDRLTPRDYGEALRVSFASRVDQVFLKLYAWADRREPRDFQDLHELVPTTDELRAGAAWARTHNMPGPFDDEMARALADLGVEDEGRVA